MALPTQLVGNRALPGHHQRVVERVDELQTSLGGERIGVALGGGVVVTNQHDLRIHPAHRLYP